MARTGVKMNAANTVTLTRMFLIPVFLVVMLAELPGAPEWFEALQPWLAAGVFTLLAATDGVDGYLARSRNEVTTFGKFLDPLADKLLVTAALLGLIDQDVLPAWIAFVIISREFIVSGLRMVASAEGEVIAASWYGKVKTVLQIVAIVMFIVKDSMAIENMHPQLSLAFELLSWAVMLAAVAMTILSMIDYFRNAADVLRGPWTGGDVSPATAVSGEDLADETVG